jgi:hypothetical protein
MAEDCSTAVSSRAMGEAQGTAVDHVSLTTASLRLSGKQCLLRGGLNCADVDRLARLVVRARNLHLLTGKFL